MSGTGVTLGSISTFSERGPKLDMVCLVVVGTWRAGLASQLPALSVGASLFDCFLEAVWRLFLGHRVCFPIGVYIWALLSQPQLGQIFLPLTSWRPDAPGFIGNKEEEKGADNPPHRFRSENWLVHPVAGWAQVA